MKRKIVNGFLLMAFFVSSVSMFVACKDYDEDVYVDLKSQLAKEKTLRELLQQQVDELEAFAKSIEQCKCNLEAELAEYLKKSEADETYLKKEDLKDYLDAVAIRQTVIEILNEVLADINAKLENCATKDDINALTIQINGMNETITLLQSQVEEALRLAQAAQCNCDLEPIKSRLDALEALAAGWADVIAELMKTAGDALALAKTDSILIDKLTKELEALKNKVDNLPSGGSCSCNGSGSCKCDGNGSCSCDGNTGSSCSCDLSAIKEELAALTEEMADKATKEELANVKKELEDAIEEIKKIADDAMAKAEEALQKASDNADAIDALDVRVGQLETTLNEVVADVADLKTRVAALEKDVNDLKEKVQILDSKISKLVEDLQNMITGITVQAAESPVIGYLNTPLGVNSTILAVYYGTPVEKWDFPSAHSKNYVKVSEYEKWTENNYRRLEVLGVQSPANIEGHISGEANTMMVTNDGKAGNAGTLYLTVNPASVNFAGQTLKLVDSQDGAAPAVLSPLAYSDRTLSFGFTRAEGNGFYEAKATISKENVEKAKMNVDYNALQEDVKSLLQDRTKSDVLELGATLLKNASNVLPAYGVAASWQDKSVGTVHNLYSQYNVAATAVKPLSLAFLQDWKGINNVPGLGRLQNVVGRLIDKIRIDLNLPEIGDLDDITFEEVSVDGIDFSKLNVKLTLRLDGDGTIKVVGKNSKIYTATIENGQVVKVVRDEDQKEIVFDKTGDSYYIDEARIKNELIDGKWFFTCYYYFGNEVSEVMQELADEFNGSIPGDLADLFNELKKLSTIDDAIADTKNSIKEQINKYLSRVNNKLANWISRAPGLLRLTMIASANNKVGMLSQSKYMPTKATNAVALFPTTYSLELLAPTYKKFVAVTDVFDANGTPLPLSEAKAKAAAANNGENMKSLIDGTTICTLNGESGYIYEVTYTAVDYFGKVSLRNYYVKF